MIIVPFGQMGVTISDSARTLSDLVPVGHQVGVW